MREKRTKRREGKKIDRKEEKMERSLDWRTEKNILY